MKNKTRLKYFTCKSICAQTQDMNENNSNQQMNVIRDVHTCYWHNFKPIQLIDF